MTTRAKFRCSKIEDFGNGSKLVHLAVVCLSDAEKSPENKSFTRWTPSGTIQMQIDNPAASCQFEPQKYYYVDFSEASDTPVPAPAKAV